MRVRLGAPPENGAARSIVRPTPRADLEINTRAEIPTWEFFDEQPLAEFAGYIVLAWRPAADGGSRLGFAKIRLPNVADTVLFVSLHCDGRQLWTEAAADTPRRCWRRLERALPLLRSLIVRAIGGEAIARMVRARDAGGSP